MVLFEIAHSLGIVVDIRPHLNYFDYHEELDPHYCDTHWTGKELSVPHYTDSGDGEGEVMDKVLAEFPTEKGLIKWSANSGVQEEMQFAHHRVSNIAITQ
jgi:hypothetical protein